jgi:hypothetical protein
MYSHRFLFYILIIILLWYQITYHQAQVVQHAIDKIIFFWFPLSFRTPYASKSLLHFQRYHVLIITLRDQSDNNFTKHNQFL